MRALSFRGIVAAGLAWLGLLSTPDVLAAEEPASEHVLILLVYSLTLLLVTLAIIRWREFSSADESDV